ncbi:MAG: SH2 domain-containing protein [Anaerolineae bacterium]
MKVGIQSKTVQKNIELFKELIRRQSHKEKPSSNLDLVTYAAYVNCKTGDLCFSEMVPDLKSLRKHEWKPILFHMMLSNIDSKAEVFEIVEEERGKIDFQLADFQPGAYKVMAETMKTLNFISHRLHKLKDADKVLNELASVEVELIGKNIVEEAWHDINRESAEMLLKNQENGTFIFRKDEFAIILQNSLSKSLKHPIKCLTLTFLDEHGKVVDKTIVKFNGHWVFYDDDPNLEGPFHASIYALLNSMKDQLRIPLLTKLAA